MGVSPRMEHVHIAVIHVLPAWSLHVPKPCQTCSLTTKLAHPPLQRHTRPKYCFAIGGFSKAGVSLALFRHQILPMVFILNLECRDNLARFDPVLSTQLPIVWCSSQPKKGVINSV